MTGHERDLLLYFETQAVEHGGALETARMQGAALEIARRWNAAGYLRFGRIPFRYDVKSPGGVRRDFWCLLSEDAWKQAHAERRARCARAMERLGLPDTVLLRSTTPRLKPGA